MSNVKITRADLDIYEDDHVTLITEDESTEELHKALLSPGLKKSSKITISIEFDENATKNAENRVDWY